MLIDNVAINTETVENKNDNIHESEAKKNQIDKRTLTVAAGHTRYIFQNIISEQIFLFMLLKSCKIEYLYGVT